MSESSQPVTPRAGKPRQCLDAAQRLFAALGYGHTSMDAIAAEAGVSKATVYAHFENKKGLFAAMVDAECRRCVDRMAIPADVHDLALETALRRIAVSFIDVGLSPRVLAIFRIVIAENRRFPELGEIFYRSGPRTTLDGVISYLRRACAQGLLQIADVEIVAMQFLGMLRGDMQIRALLGMPCTAVQRQCAAETAVAAFLRAYRVPDRSK